jgi:hypothetical protein
MLFYMLYFGVRKIQAWVGLALGESHKKVT